MRNPKGFIIEIEKEGRVSLIVVIAVSAAQALEIARRERDADRATVLDETEVILAD